jgi:hypothetical protein
MVRFRSRGHGRDRRVYPIRESSRHRKERFRDRDYQTFQEIENAAETFGSDSRPIGLVALRRRPDGRYDTFMQKFNNWNAARRAAESLRKEGYEVGAAEVRMEINGKQVSPETDHGRSWR